MPKKYSVKFWIIFWLTSAVLLVGWHFFLQWRAGGLGQVVENLPVNEKYKALTYFSDYVLKNDDREKTFLVLFQNNLEIRPGGGFIGSFGILKMKNGKILALETHDTGIFDGRIPDTVEPPYPMKETLRIKSWKLRDSNWSPDWPTNAQKAEEFYYLGQGREKFDGVIGITANVLTSFLKATGPVSIEGYPGTYGDENAVIMLEYQVEKAFEEQGIARGERKSVLTDLAKEIMKKVFELDSSKKIELGKIILEDLNEKDIQLYFHDAVLQAQAEKAGWSGEMDKAWKKDFLMATDANLGAWKSDYYIKRTVDYALDLSGENPKAVLKITYNHTAKQKDFMTKDYLTYLRVYVPEGAWLVKSKNFDGARFGNESGKKYFGAIVKVPLNSSKTVELEYNLPKEIEREYDLKIQKQAGVNNVPVKVEIINSEGGKKNYDLTLNGDWVLGKAK